MSKLSDFNPIQSFSLPGIESLEAKGLTIVVGPNSSGKSQFLHDISDRLTGRARELVVLKALDLSLQDANAFIECLKANGLVEIVHDHEGKPHLRSRAANLANGDGIPQIPSVDPTRWRRDAGEANIRPNEYLKYFGRFLVTGLFLDRRLTSVNETNTYDFAKEAPQNELHALFLDDVARAALLREMQSVFGKAVWPDMSVGNRIVLKVSEDGVLPDADRRHSFKEMSKYRSVSSEGDGMKSYVAIAIALLLGIRPICLIDEPEMCLHPPQAYALGQFIGTNGHSPDTITLVSTHSSHVLRGAILSEAKLQIVRMTRSNGAFHAHLVSASHLREVLRKPTVRAESILDGIFSQAIVIVESDTDRTLYQAAWESLKDELRLDLHFAAVGGTGGFIDTYQLYKTLEIPTVVIADLDFLMESTKLERLLQTMTTLERSVDLVRRGKEIAVALKELPPTMGADELRTSLAEILQAKMEWSEGDDEEIRSELSRLSNDIDRMRRIKRGGRDNVPAPTKELLDAWIIELSAVGLFLVPVGELECWLRGETITASKNSKGQWANEAAAIVRNRKVGEGDVWDFMRAVGKFLGAESVKEVVEVK